MPIRCRLVRQPFPMKHGGGSACRAPRFSLRSPIKQKASACLRWRASREPDYASGRILRAAVCVLIEVEEGYATTAAKARQGAGRRRFYDRS